MYLFVTVFVHWKVNPEDVGGEEVLNSIKITAEETLDNALQITESQRCYCEEPLDRRLWNRPYSGSWRCLSCFTNQSGRITFRCPNDTCLFKRHSGWIYRVCPSCFWNSAIHHETDEKDDEMKDTFIALKIKRRISMISSDSLFLFQCLIDSILGFDEIETITITIDVLQSSKHLI